MKNRNNITKNNQNSASFRRINIGEIKHPCMITPHTSEQDTKGKCTEISGCYKVQYTSYPVLKDTVRGESKLKETLCY